MRILLIHHRIPYPLFSGMDKVRYNLIKVLAKEHTVDLIVPADENTSNEDIEHVRGICSRLIVVHVSNKLKKIQKSKKEYLKRHYHRLIKRIPNYITNNFYPEISAYLEKELRGNKYDVVQALSDVTGIYLYDVRNEFKIAGPLDDTLNSSYTDMVFEPNYVQKLGWYIEHLARRSWQPKICRHADKVFYFSTKDMNHLNQVTRNKQHSEVLPTIVETDESWQPAAMNAMEKNSLIFLGGLGSHFNNSAVIFFINKILPLVKAEIPSVKLYVVGQHPPKSVRNLNDGKNIIVTGKVDNVVPYIENAEVYISPIYAGTGFKTKIVEAIRYGKAIVSTKAGLQGMWDLGQDVFSIADTPVNFAGEIIKLLNTPLLIKQRGIRARQLFEKSYTFEKIAPSILKVYEKIEKDINNR